MNFSDSNESNKLIIPPYGFKNTGAICYFNALVQCLLSSRKFLNFIVDHTNKYNLFQEFLYNISQDRWDVLFTTRLLYLCDMVNSNQSSSEYFIKLIDLLKLEPLFEAKYNDHILCTNCNHSVNKQDISYNMLVNDDFSEFFEFSEEIEQFNCEHCKEKTKIVKRKTLSGLSDITAICLNKYFGKKMLYYPQEFLFLNNRYRLIGTVEHIGTLNGGHYISRFRRNGKCYLADDFNVMPTNEEEIPAVSETYIIFYEKV
jgi:ubiquitin C-terminal hydrolase